MKNKPLRIVQILPELNNGGVERGTVEIANFLADKGHTSIVVSAGGGLCQQLDDRVEHICLNVGEKSLFSFALIKKLRNLFIEKKIDIVHARSRFPAWLAYFALAKIRSQKPKFVTTVHGLYSVKRYSSIMARGERVIAVSKTAKRYVLDHYSDFLKTDPQVIYRGIDADEFPYHHQAEFMWLHHWYEKNHQLVGHKTVLLPGRITALKGLKELEHWLKSKNNDAKLVLTADPEKDMAAAKLYHWFEKIGVGKRIVWVGNQTQMANLYAVVDVVVSASTRPEAFGRTALEALAVGTPVAAYNHGGVAEILGEIFPLGQVEPFNKQKLAEKINSLLTETSKVPNVHPFLLQDMLDQTHLLYRELIS